MTGWLERWPGHGATVAGLTGKDSPFANGFRTGAEGRDLARVEVTFEVSKQAAAEREAGE